VGLCEGVSFQLWSFLIVKNKSFNKDQDGKVTIIKGG
jgi:hypothetical protein